MPGAHCLDLFAGSGAFGFEALSRGAARAVLVDSDREVLAALHENAAQLKAGGAEIVEREALSFLNGPVESFDVVFLDPPYASGLLAPCLALLADRGWLRPGARIYFEARKDEVLSLPRSLELVRSKIAGQVGYHLARTTGTEEAA